MDELRTVQIRNMPPDLWLEIRAEAVRRGLDTADLLGLVWREWVACQKAPAGVR